MKPPPDIILASALEELYYLHTVGLDINTAKGNKHAQVKLLLAVCDLPAKSMVLNQKQYNGFHACNVCLDEGFRLSCRMLYLPSKAHSPKTHADIQRCAKVAEETGRLSVVSRDGQFWQST